MNIRINPCVTPKLQANNNGQKNTQVRNVAFGTKFDIAPEVNTKLTSCLKNLQEAYWQAGNEKATNGRHKHLLVEELNNVIGNFTRKLYQDTILHNNTPSNHLIKDGSEKMHKIDIYTSPKFIYDGGKGTYTITPENIAQKANEGIDELVFRVNGPAGGLNGTSVHYKFKDLAPEEDIREFSKPELKDRDNCKLPTENWMTSLQETLPEPTIDELFKKISSK